MSATDAERLAVLETRQTALEATFARMESKIDQLTADANRGKGAIAVLISIGTIFGGVIGWLASRISFH